MPAKKEEIRIQLCCVGLGKGAGSQALVPLWREVLDRGKLGEQNLLWAKVRRARPGGVYSFATPSLAAFKAGKIYTKSMLYFKPWHDKRAVAQWEAETAALETAYAVERKAKELESAHGVLREALSPLRERYAKSNALGRAALIGWVIQELDR